MVYDVIPPEPNKVVPNKELFDNLWHFCSVATNSNRAMLLGNVLECLRLLNAVQETSYGLHENVYQSQQKAMEGYLKHFTRFLQNKEALEFIQSHTDAEVFGADERCKSDYIRTYNNLYRFVDPRDEEFQVVQYFED